MTGLLGKAGVVGPSAEEILRALTQAADQAPLGIAISYSDTAEPDVLYVNEGTGRLVGWSLEEIRARPIWTLFAPDELPRLAEMHERARAGAATPRAETVILHKDGRRVPVEFSTTAITLDGRAANVTFFFDITHRKTVEEGLRKSEARFRSLIQGAPDGVVILRWPQISFINPRAAAMLGQRDPSVLVGTPITDHMAPDEREAAEERIEQVQREGRPITPREYWGKDPEGRPLSVEVSSIPIEYEGAPAILAFVRDVTERKQFLSQLTEADKLAAVGSLAAGVAHEINNPLAYLMLNIDFVLRELSRGAHTDPATAELLRPRLEEAKQGAERVRTIVRDLQTLTRRDEDLRGPVELESVVEQALQMTRHQIGPRVRIERRIEDVPPVYGNTTRLEQLFLNLFINAAHALEGTKAEQSVIEVRIRTGPERTVIAEVSDTGIGMEPDVLAHAFDPFFTTKPMGIGTGLGLPICRGIVQALGGEITLHSTQGVGTTARVVLREHGTEAGSVPAPPPSNHEELARPRKRVLIVDDEPAVALSLSHELGRRHEVQVARSAAEARAALESGVRFDAVLCDLGMPGESGMALYDGISKSHPEIAERFVFMSGGTFLPEVENFLARVQTPWVEKPFDLERLHEAVDSITR